MKTCKHKTGFRARNITGTFEKRAPGARFLKVPIINGPGARFSKVPITNGPAKLLLFTCKEEASISDYIKDRGFTSFASNMIEL